MVLAKNVDRFAGTALGMLAPLVIGALVQQAELHALGTTVRGAACTALAARHRQLR